jgi:hypothetical protein
VFLAQFSQRLVNGIPELVKLLAVCDLVLEDSLQALNTLIDASVVESLQALVVLIKQLDFLLLTEIRE